MKRIILSILNLIGRAFLRLVGWKLVNQLPDIPKFVVIGGPHTSYWDTIYALGVVWALNIKPSIMMKHTMFRPAVVGAFFRMLGAFPVDRTAPGGIVKQTIDGFASRDQWIVAVAPEGRRNDDKSNPWKTGFYRIAAGANVPIVAIQADFKHRLVTVAEPMMPTGDMEGDIAKLKAFIDAGNGYHYTE